MNHIITYLFSLLDWTFHFISWVLWAPVPAVRRIVQLHQFSPYHLISWIWVPPPSLRESSVPSSEDIYNVNQYSFIICVTPYSFLHPVPLRSSMTHSVSPSERNRAYRITSKPFNHQQWSHGTEGAARGRWDNRYKELVIICGMSYPIFIPTVSKPFKPQSIRSTFGSASLRIWW